MTNEEIFKKAIDKAVKSGWKGFNFIYATSYNNTENNGNSINPDTILRAIDEIKTEYGVNGTIEIIFSHDFVKAFWGEEIIGTNTFGESWEDGEVDGELYIDGGEEIELPAWQHHLQQMVLEEEPLKYLEKFL